MGEFITGVLTRNAPGAQYEGAVYDRWITLQHASGVSLKIFDRFLPIGTELAVGTRYEVIVSALVPIGVAIFSAAPPELPQGWWEGTIRELEWRAAAPAAYRYAQADFATGSWLLVETQVGSLLMAPRAVREAALAGGKTALQVGDSIQWDSTRLDLQAVL
ncbi:MAG TPA: hypothetical protein VGS80_02010 [Ktedonobacterales bacterium]|nr:hypothetical protein [Ktedonobacterales bacterium]